MKFSRLLFFVCLLSCAALARAQDVKVDYDRGGDFSKFKTYAWQPVEHPHPYVHRQIVDALDTQLQSRGLKKVEKDADLHLVYMVGVARGLEASRNGGTSPPGWIGPGDLGVTSRVMEVKSGVLLIGLSDASTKGPVWRATAKDTLGDENGIDLNKRAERAEKRVRKALDKMFRKFPVPQTAGKG